MIRFVVPREQEFGIVEFLASDAHDVAGTFSVLHYEDLPSCTSLPSGCYVLAALDQLTPQALRLVAGIEAQLRLAGPSIAVLNSATRTLHRLALLETLRARGLNHHRAVHATNAFGTLTFPVFVREEHRHTGAMSALLDSRLALETELARCVLRGYRLDELLVVEFVDTADTDGVYRKYAAHRVGDAIVPQFVDVARSWMLKRDAGAITAAMIREEEAYVMANPHERELRQIFDVAGVGFGRIDYAVRDGRIHTWEINLNPTLGGYAELPPDLDRLRQVRRGHFARAFMEAFRAVDVKEGGPDVPIRHEPDVLTSLDGMLRRDRDRRAADLLAKVARPLRPLVDVTVRRLSRFIVALARGSSRQR